MIRSLVPVAAGASSSSRSYVGSPSWRDLRGGRGAESFVMRGRRTAKLAPHTAKLPRYVMAFFVGLGKGPKGCNRAHVCCKILGDLSNLRILVIVMMVPCVQETLAEHEWQQCITSSRGFQGRSLLRTTLPRFALRRAALLRWH